MKYQRILNLTAAIQDLLPLEIKIIIFKLFDDKTRRIARLTCNEWFDIIDYRDFKVYLTTKSSWPQIVDRLSRYNRPITLNLHKNIMNQLKDINEHLLRLTNSALEIWMLENSGNDASEWLKLTALSRLQLLRTNTRASLAATELLVHLPNLTRFDSWHGQNLSEEKLVQSLRQWTNLENCSIRQDEELTCDNLFENYHTKLTQLTISGISKRSAENALKRLTNLVALNIGLSEAPDAANNCISLKFLTSLERLAGYGDAICDINSKYLTELQLYSVKEHTIKQELSQFVNLKRLKIGAHEKMPDFSWLTNLTRLEDLDIAPVHSIILSFVTPTVTQLQIQVTAPKLTNLGKFAALKELHMNCLLGSVDLTEISTMTRLHTLDLVFALQSTQSTLDGNLLAPLSNLTRLDISSKPIVVTELPNLEYLAILYHTDHNAAFPNLPKLTELTLKMVRGLRSFNLSFLTTLTALESLRCFNIKLSDHDFVATDLDYEYMAQLSRLTQLSLMYGKKSAKWLELPSSLQTLNIVNLHQEPADPEFFEKLAKRLPNLYQYSLQ